MAGQPLKAVPRQRGGSAATCFLQPAGSTTGPSKAAVHTHRSMKISTLGGIAVYRLDTRTRYLAVAPLTHAGGVSAPHTLAGRDRRAKQHGDARIL